MPNNETIENVVKILINNTESTSLKEEEREERKKHGEAAELYEECRKTLKETREIWVKKQYQIMELKAGWSILMMLVLVSQIIYLGFVLFNVVPVISIEVFKIYIGVVFVELLVIPKQIANHLFPASEINDASQILQILLNKDKAINQEIKKD